MTTAPLTTTSGHRPASDDVSSAFNYRSLFLIRSPSAGRKWADVTEQPWRAERGYGLVNQRRTADGGVIALFHASETLCWSLETRRTRTQQQQTRVAHPQSSFVISRSKTRTACSNIYRALSLHTPFHKDNKRVSISGTRASRVL